MLENNIPEKELLSNTSLLKLDFICPQLLNRSINLKELNKDELSNNETLSNSDS